MVFFKKKKMQVDCAADAMELLATSSRVYEDLVRALGPLHALRAT